MKKVLSIILSSILVVGVFGGCGNKSVSKDDTKTTSVKTESTVQKKEQKVILDLKLERVPEKTVAGTVAIAELLEVLDIDMVGVPSTQKTISEKLKGKSTIGKPMNPDIEKVKSLNPDLFISVESLKDSLEKNFNGQNIKTVFLPNNSYEDIINSLNALGKAYKKEEKSKAIVKDMRNREEKILGQIKDKKPPKVMVIFGTPGSFTLATDKSFTGDIIKKLGAKNITDELGEVKESYIPFSMEKAMTLKPDIILRLTHASPTESKKMFEKEFAENKLWQSFDAVKNKKVIDLDNKYFGVSADIKAIDSLEQMAKILYD